MGAARAVQANFKGQEKAAVLWMEGLREKEGREWKSAVKHWFLSCWMPYGPNGLPHG